MLNFYNTRRHNRKLRFALREALFANEAVAASDSIGVESEVYRLDKVESLNASLC